MKALTYRMRLLEPTLVSLAETGEENSAIGLSYVPGSAIRGAIVSRYMKLYHPKDLAADANTRELFLDGTVCYLNAYPAPEGKRLLPKPLSWFTEKDLAKEKSGTFYDFAAGSSAVLKQAKPPGGQADYCSIYYPEHYGNFDVEAIASGNEPPRVRVQFFSCAREVNVHIALISTNIRTDQNKVYRYEALAPGEILSGAIIAPDYFSLDPLKKIMEQDKFFYFGGAHTAGYGRTQIENLEIYETWSEYVNHLPSTGRTIITLLSDTIIRTNEGQISADFDRYLAEKLQIPALAAISKFQKVDIAGGYNRKWALPIVQAWVLKAGSVFVYNSEKLDPSKLASLVSSGIGERRAEGFGRFAVDWNCADIADWARVQRLSVAPPELCEESRSLAKQMVQRRLESMLERGLAAYIIEGDYTPRPKNAQLAQVRNAAQEAMLTGKLTPIEHHLAALKGDARKQFENAHTKKISMYDWLDAQIKKPDIQANLIKDSKMPVVAGISAVITPEMKVRYTARLIDIVMKKAIRLNQEAANE